MEQLEETFVKILSETFRDKIDSEGIFNSDIFTVAIKGAISELLDLTLNLENKDVFELLNNPVDQVLTLFGSKLLENETGLIDKK